MNVISNTTVISNFCSVGQTELLHRLFNKLYISSQVFDEIRAGFLQGYAFYHNIESIIHPFTDNGWLHLTSLYTPSEFQTFGKLLSNLHNGEASCLSVAFHRGWMFLSDDKAARNAATKAGVAISGTLGVLLSSVKKHIITVNEGDSILQTMIRNGYYSPVSSLDDI